MSSQQSTTAGEGPGQPGAGGGAGAGQGQAGAGAGGQPSEEELRAAYEAELERITTAEVIMQTAVSLLNLGARRLRPPEDPAGVEAGTSGAGAGRDLEQVRDAIDGVRALMGVLERRYPRELAPLRDALSQLQLAYARDAQSGGAQPEAGSAGTEEGAARPQASDPGAPAGAGAGTPGEAKPPDEGASQEQEEPGRGPGPAESSGRLWVPGR
jgi:hypothetical protein